MNAQIVFSSFEELKIQDVSFTDPIRPNVIVAGENIKDWLLDPAYLDSIQNPGEYGGGVCDFVGWGQWLQNSSDYARLSGTDEKRIQYRYSYNRNFSSRRAIDPMDCKEIKIDCEGILSNEWNNWVQLLISKTSLLNTWDWYTYINPQPYTVFTLQSTKNSIESINSQRYLDINTTNNKCLNRQFVTLDVEGLKNAGILTGAFYIAFHTCDCGFYLRSIELIH